MCYNLTATVYNKRGNIIAVGKNSYTKTHTIQSKYAKRVGEIHKVYLHAEIDALIKAQGKGYKIKIERYGKNGEPKNAKPCPICELAIKEAGIKFVEYTVG
jgi:deoxycytidylate deaminase